MGRKDNSSLRLGHSPVSCRDIHLIGLQTKVYGLDEIAESNLPVALVVSYSTDHTVSKETKVVLHGRGGRQEDMADFTQGVLGQIREEAKGSKKLRDVIALTMDQRNHGTRLVDKVANQSYDQNPNHLIDMTACIMGGSQDVSLVISCLAPYLFPNGEKTIDQYIMTGHSLGANVTWRILRDEPRIKIAIPLQGLPLECHLPYLGARAENMGLKCEPPLCPPSLRPLLEAPMPEGVYRDKKILSIHGGSDEVVPYRFGQKVISAIQNSAPKGEVEVVVLDGVVHEVTLEMVHLTADWIWKWSTSA